MLEATAFAADAAVTLPAARVRLGLTIFPSCTAVPSTSNIKHKQYQEEECTRVRNMTVRKAGECGRSLMSKMPL